MACEVGSFECVDLLIGANAIIDYPAGAEAPLHLTCGGTGAGTGGSRLKIVKLLLEHQASVDNCDGEQWTPLHFAALRGYNNICKRLIESNASLSSRTNEGATPLELGCTSGGLTIELIEILSSDEGSGVENVTTVDIADRSPQLLNIPPFLQQFRVRTALVLFFPH